MEAPTLVCVGEAGDPFGGGREQHPVPGFAAPDRQPSRQVGLAGPGRPEEQHVVLGGDEVQVPRWAMRSRLRAGVVEVELPEALAPPEAGGPEAAFPPWLCRARPRAAGRRRVEGVCVCPLDLVEEHE